MRGATIETAAIVTANNCFFDFFFFFLFQFVSLLLRKTKLRNA